MKYSVEVPQQDRHSGNDITISPQWGNKDQDNVQGISVIHPGKRILGIPTGQQPDQI